MVSSSPETAIFATGADPFRIICSTVPAQPATAKRISSSSAKPLVKRRMVGKGKGTGGVAATGIPSAQRIETLPVSAGDEDTNAAAQAPPQRAQRKAYGAEVPQDNL